MSNNLPVDLYQPIVAARPGAPPLYLRVYVDQGRVYAVGGAQVHNKVLEPYILLSALPEELKMRVKVAIEALQAGM